MAIELVSWSPPGFPAVCQVTSQNSGPPENIRSNRLIRLDAPVAVRGGKNSSEKNRSPLEILDYKNIIEFIADFTSHGPLRWKFMIGKVNQFYIAAYGLRKP